MFPTKPQPRILMVANYYEQYGGISAVVENLVRGLTREGYDVSLHNVGGLLPRVWTKQISRRVESYLRLLPTARHYDLIHSHCSIRWGFLPAVVSAVAASICHKPLVVTFHTHSDIPFVEKNPAVGFVARRSQVITTPFRVTTEPFRRHGITALAIPNVLDDDQWVFRQREEFKPRMVWTRNVYHAKLAIEAFLEVRRTHPDATLSMCGRAASKEAQPDYQHTSGLSLFGHVPREKLPAMLDAADIYINTAYHDTFGYAVYEAMAMGLAIVSVESPALRDMAGDAAITFSASSTPESLAQAIESVLVEREKTLARVRYGRQLVAKFGWEAVFPEWRDVYDTALASHP